MGMRLPASTGIPTEAAQDTDNEIADVPPRQSPMAVLARPTAGRPLPGKVDDGVSERLADWHVCAVETSGGRLRASLSWLPKVFTVD